MKQQSAPFNQQDAAKCHYEHYVRVLSLRVEESISSNFSLMTPAIALGNGRLFSCSALVGGSHPNQTWSLLSNGRPGLSATPHQTALHAHITSHRKQRT